MAHTVVLGKLQKYVIWRIRSFGEIAKIHHMAGKELIRSQPQVHATYVDT